MLAEQKVCQNCKQAFTIEPDDFDFYAKIKVPAPTFCPECRMIRRMLFRNERTLYKQPCNICGKTIISMYAPEKEYTVYCNECFASDTWSPLEFGLPYDFQAPFFDQLDKLLRKTPRRATFQDFFVNTEYANNAVYASNSYLIFGGHHYEDTAYSAQNFYLKNCFDVDFSMKCEYCWNSVHLRRCNRVFASAYSEDCMDSWLLYGCRSCSSCIGCTNLRGKSYCIFNEQYSKESYEKAKKQFALHTRQGFGKALEIFDSKTLGFPRKYASIRNIVNSTGDDLERVKNCIRCFSATEDENIRYSFFVPTGAKDCYDLDHVGLGAHELYEVHSSFGSNRVLFSNRCYDSSNVYYSDDCYHCDNLFGCVSLRKKSYCIFNKQYSKEEYDTLFSKIVEHMSTQPFIERMGQQYGFGEFFPPSITPFAYNESVAQEYFPLDENEAAEKGFGWRKPEEKNYVITIPWDSLQDAMELPSGIENEIIGCRHEGKCKHNCPGAFKLIQREVAFYKSNGIPVPDLCPNCRHGERLLHKNPLKLWERQCACQGIQSSEFGVQRHSDSQPITPNSEPVSSNPQLPISSYLNTTSHFHGTTPCPNAFQTSYAPDRPEIVYCEQCYNAEVV